MAYNTKEFINRVYAQLRGLIIGLKYSSADLAYNTKGPYRELHV